MRTFFSKNRIYALVILLTSVLFSVVIAKNGGVSKQDALVSIESPVASETSQKNSPYFASIQLPTPGAVTPEPIVSQNTPPSDNITENVLNAYTLQILKQNPKGSGLTPGKGIAVPTEDTLNSLVSNQLNTQSITIPTYSVRDIRVSTEVPTKDDLATYFKAVVDAHTKEFKNVTANYFLGIVDAFQNGRMAVVQGQLDAASRYVTDLLSIKVPSGWGAFHVELLNIWQARFSLGTMISQSGDDPLKAYMALNKLSDSFDEEDRLLETLTTEIGKYQNNPTL